MRNGGGGGGRGGGGGGGGGGGLKMLLREVFLSQWRQQHAIVQSSQRGAFEPLARMCK